MYSGAGYKACKRGSATRYYFFAAWRVPKDKSTEGQEAECHFAYQRFVKTFAETRQESDETLAGVKKMA